MEEMLILGGRSLLHMLLDDDESSATPRSCRYMELKDTVTLFHMSTRVPSLLASCIGYRI